MKCRDIALGKAETNMGKRTLAGSTWDLAHVDFSESHAEGLPRRCMVYAGKEIGPHLINHSYCFNRRRLLRLNTWLYEHLGSSVRYCIFISILQWWGAFFSMQMHPWSSSRISSLLFLWDICGPLNWAPKLCQNVNPYSVTNSRCWNLSRIDF